MGCVVEDFVLGEVRRLEFVVGEVVCAGMYYKTNKPAPALPLYPLLSKRTAGDVSCANALAIAQPSRARALAWRWVPAPAPTAQISLAIP